MKSTDPLRGAAAAVGQSIRTIVSDIGRGMLVISHNMLALLGLAVLAVLLFAAGRADLRHQVETQALAWLQARELARADPVDALLMAAAADDPHALRRVTATDPAELAREQAAVAGWIARRYRVAPEPVSRLVQEAWQVGGRVGVEPTLILAIMAIESRFNPFAQSQAGAQGLMQVMTRVHDDKYEAFGGRLAAFDPLTNLRVGVMVLKECIARAGGLEEGLRHYVGAANLDDDGGYASKVMGEHTLLRQVAAGRAVPVNAVVEVRVAARPAGAAAGEGSASAPADAGAVEAAPAELAPADAEAGKVALLAVR